MTILCPYDFGCVIALQDALESSSLARYHGDLFQWLWRILVVDLVSFLSMLSESHPKRTVINIGGFFGAPVWCICSKLTGTLSGRCWVNCCDIGRGPLLAGWNKSKVLGKTLTRQLLKTDYTFKRNSPVLSMSTTVSHNIGKPCTDLKLKVEAKKG